MWGDPATHYLGWEFFRRGPLDAWPVGSSPLYGAGYSSSVVYSDSVPLLAIPLKFLLRGVSGHFQYLGFWIFVCFIGQGLAGLKLVKNLRVPHQIQLPLALMFSLMPAFLYRMIIGGFGHIALVSHFLLLSALALALQPYSTKLWGAVLIVSVLTHGYIFLMVAMIYVSTVIQLIVKLHKLTPRIRPSDLIRSACVVGLSSLSIAYIVGYFDTPRISEEGFGVYRADALTFLDPNTIDSLGWSRILIDIPWSYQANEGYAFGGVGVLLLIATSSKFFITGARKLVPLLSISIIMFAFSLSNRILIGGRELVVIPLPEWLLKSFGSARSSGRFTWPLMYVVLCIGIVAASTLYKQRRALSAFLVASVVIVQCFDALPAYREIRERFVESGREVSVLQSPEWDILALNRTCLLTVPVQFKGKNWINFAELALRNNMSTNAAYLARFDESAINAQTASLSSQITSGNLKPECLYVLVSDNPTKESAIISSQYLAIKDQATRKVRVVDGFIVVLLE